MKEILHFLAPFEPWAARIEIAQLSPESCTAYLLYNII
jgi:hypothetical protein